MSSGPVVVAILSHRDPVLLRRLTQRVVEGSNAIALVHHDPRGEPHGLTESDRVRLVPNAQPCDWGRMNLARAMLRCAETAHTFVPELGWLLLVSGQDYPCLPMTTIEQRLQDCDADAMLRHFQVSASESNDTHPWQAVCRRRYLRRIRIPGSRRSVPFPRRHPFRDGTRLFVGDMWVNLGAAALQHVLAQRRALPQVESYLGRCAVPDEALLPTLLLNDAAHLQIRNEHHRYIKWTPGQPHPAMLSVDDVADILDTDAYFARKVDSCRTPQVLDLLDEAASAH
jgi:hypothetical protein